MSNQMDNEMWLIEENDESSVQSINAAPPWRILIVDDEADIHSVTRLALLGVTYKNRPLEFLSAYTVKEGMQILEAEKDIALVFLDVMMETDDAGLQLVSYVREVLKNHLIRVVLRTGQPGQAPERDVILQYDINDYKSKTELTNQKLFTTVIASLRAYEGLVLIDRSRKGLERILEASTDLYHVHSLREFASSVLNQISTILDVGADGVLCLLQPVEDGGEKVPTVIAATGSYVGLVDKSPDLSASQLWKIAEDTFREKRNRFEHPIDALYVETVEHRQFVVLVSPPWPLAELQRNLLEMFCNKISWAFDNLFHINEMH
jgi:CheY-like chemotaxis protein